MGGGNGLKSHMAKQKNAQKAAAKKSGGGGAVGIENRTASAQALHCAICRTQFINAKMKAQRLSNQSCKYWGITFAACFPGVDP